MSRVLKVAPYTQGQLDGLCGVYSIINAVRFALPKVAFGVRSGITRRSKLPVAEAEALFLGLLKELVRERRHADRLVHGVSPRQLAALLKVADHWLRRHRAVKLAVDRPVRGHRRDRTRTILKRIAQHLATPGSVAIVGGNDPWQHWTVATAVTARRVYLLDSEGDASVAIRRGRRRLQYHAGLLDSRSLFLITLLDRESDRNSMQRTHA
jgi:hypothetical protein